MNKRSSCFRHDLQQHNAAGERRYDTLVWHPRAPAGGDSASPRAPEMFGDRERGDERQAQPAAVGSRASAGRNRDADLRGELDLERRG